MKLFPELNPMAATCLALNAAYLRLGPFQYRQQIRDKAQAATDGLDELHTDLKKSSHYRHIVELANHPKQEQSPDLTDTPHVNKLCRWLLLGVDRKLAATMVVVSTLYIAAAGINATQIWNFTLAGGHPILVCLWMLFSLAIALSVSLIFFGDRVVADAIGEVAHSRSELELSMKAATQAVSVTPIADDAPSAIKTEADHGEAGDDGSDTSRKAT